MSRNQQFALRSLFYGFAFNLKYWCILFWIVLNNEQSAKKMLYAWKSMKHYKKGSDYSSPSYGFFVAIHFAIS